MKNQTKLQAVEKTATEMDGKGAPLTDDGEADAAAAEADGLKAENAGLRNALQVSTAREQLTQALLAAGARTPGLLCDAASADLQIGEDGKLTNAGALAERLRSRYPEQFRTAPPASIDAGAGRTTPPPLTKAALAKMSPAEITRLDWAAVRRVLSEK